MLKAKKTVLDRFSFVFTYIEHLKRVSFYPFTYHKTCLKLVISLVLFTSTSLPHSHICLQNCLSNLTFSLKSDLLIWILYLINTKKKKPQFFPHLGPPQNLHFHVVCSQITTSFFKISKFSYLGLLQNLHLLIGAVKSSYLCKLLCKWPNKKPSLAISVHV